MTTLQQVGKCLCNSCSKKQGWKTVRKNFTIKDVENDFSKYGYQLLDNELKLSKSKYLVQDKYGYRGNITLRDAMLGKHFSIFSCTILIYEAVTISHFKKAENYKIRC